MTHGFTVGGTPVGCSDCLPGLCLDQIQGQCGTTSGGPAADSMQDNILPASR